MPSVRVEDGFPRVTLFRLRHSAKALAPIFSTLAGIESCSSSLSPLKASCAMAVTPYVVFALVTELGMSAFPSLRAVQAMTSQVLVLVTL